MTTYSVPTTSPYWVHIGFEPPFREFFIEVLDAEHRKLLVWEQYPTLDALVRAAGLWTDLDREDFDEMFGHQAFPVGHPCRPFLRPERIVYRGVQCKIVQSACPSATCGGGTELELVVADAPEQYVAGVTSCPGGQLRGDDGHAVIAANKYPGVAELLADAGVVVPTGREIQMGCITGEVVRVIAPATRIHLDPDARPGWKCWRLFTGWRS